LRSEFRLDDVDRFQRGNKALLPMLGLKRVPGAVAIGKWLCRMGRGGGHSGGPG